VRGVREASVGDDPREFSPVQRRDGGGVTGFTWRILGPG